MAARPTLIRCCGPSLEQVGGGRSVVSPAVRGFNMRGSPLKARDTESS